MRAQESLVLSRSYNTLSFGVLCHLIHLQLAFFEHSAVDRKSSAFNCFSSEKMRRKLTHLFLNMEPAQIIANNVAFRFL
jgi:hypothetical protein